MYRFAVSTTAAARTRWFGLVAISLAVAIIIADSTIVNVSVPAIVDELGLTSTQVQWVQESYTLVFGATILVWGILADRIGRRRMLIIGITVFTIASIAAAFAPSGDLLILTRLLQGVGGAMVLPATLSLVNANFTGRDRGIAFAVWGSTIGGMAAVGPLLGGWLTTDFSWRWSFGINVPVGVLVVLGALAFVAESKGPHRRIDVLGAILTTIGFAGIVFGLIEGRTLGWWAVADPFVIGDWTWPFSLSPVPVSFAIAVVFLAAFVVRGIVLGRRGVDTLLDFSLFRISTFRDGSAVAAIVSFGEFGIILSLPLWLQNVNGLTALDTGLVLIALAAGSFLASGFAGSMSGRIDPLVIVRIGLIAEIVGVAGIAVVVLPDAGWGWLVPLLFVYGFGVGLATAQLTGVVLQDVPPQQSGAGSGVQSTARQLGSALGIALLGTVLFTATAAQLHDRLTQLELPDQVVTQITDAVVDSAGSAIPGLEATSADVHEAARAAFSVGTAGAAFTAAGGLALGLAATITLGRDRRRTQGAAAAVPAPADPASD